MHAAGELSTSCTSCLLADSIAPRARIHSCELEKETIAEQRDDCRQVSIKLCTYNERIVDHRRLCESLANDIGSAWTVPRTWLRRERCNTWESGLHLCFLLLPQTGRIGEAWSMLIMTYFSLTTRTSPWWVGNCSWSVCTIMSTLGWPPFDVYFWCLLWIKLSPTRRRWKKNYVSRL